MSEFSGAELEAVLSEVARRLEKDGFVASVQEASRVLPGARALDIDGKGVVATLSAWGSGQAEFHALHFIDGSEILFREFAFDSRGELEEAVLECVKALRLCGPEDDA